MWTRRAAALVLTLAVSGAPAAAQQPPPRPFPQPSQPRPTPPPATPSQPRPDAPQPDVGAAETPSEATLGVPIYPSAQFITSYDAGRGQRFYLFGVTLSFAEAVSYYRSTLKARGDMLFDTPPTHQFDIGRFRDDVMAFPPSVTIKDYTFGGSPGFPNPIPGAQPERFPTIIQIVPAPAGNPER